MALRLAITGSGGYLARELISRVAADADCEFILGLDVRPTAPAVSCPAEFLRFDLTEPWEKLAAAFRAGAINTGVHLAWQFNPIHNLRRHRKVDVEGSNNFFRAAESAGLKRLVYTSSTTAYVNPGNSPEPPFLTEVAPVSGTPQYLYSKHKAEVDRMAQEFMARHPEIRIVILRPAIVLGPHTRNIVSKMMEWPWRSFPWMFQVKGADPPMQFLSEEDIGEILYRAVKGDVCGIFNCSGDGTLCYSEVVRAGGKKPLAQPASWIYPMTALLWFLRLSPFPAGILDMIRYPWVADTTMLKTVFGYTPRRTSREALESFLAASTSGPGNR